MTKYNFHDPELEAASKTFTKWDKEHGFTPETKYRENVQQDREHNGTFMGECAFCGRKLRNDDKVSEFTSPTCQEPEVIWGTRLPVPNGMRHPLQTKGSVLVCQHRHEDGKHCLEELAKTTGNDSWGFGVVPEEECEPSTPKLKSPNNQN